MPGITEVLATFVAGLEYDHIPRETVERTKRSLIDAAGVMIAGRSISLGLDELLDILRHDGGVAESTVIGQTSLMPARAAAMANAAMAHQLDYDDTHDAAVVHPTANSLPMALALAERTGRLDGRTFLASIVAANEVTCRLGLSLTRLMFEYPWVRPPILGMFGAVAAGARMMGLDAVGVANAWGCLLPRVGGTLACLVEPGSWVRTMRDGLSCESAMLSVLLAERGFQGDRLPFEGKYGLFNSYFSGDYDEAVLLNGLGRDFRANEISWKPWPCCREVHGTLTAFLEAVEVHQLDLGAIESIELRVGSTNLELCEPGPIRRHPKTKTDALCNIPFNVAVAAVHGQIPLSAYLPDGLRDERVAAMAERISWRFESSQDRLGTLEPGWVAVRMKGGGTIEHRADVAIGHPSKPMSSAQLRSKFDGCLSVSDDLGRSGHAIYDAIMDLPAAGVAGLAGSLRPA